MIGLRDIWASHDEMVEMEIKTTLGSYADVEFFLQSNKATEKRLFLVRFPQEVNSDDFNNILFRSLVIQMLDFGRYKELTFVILKSELQDIFISFVEDLLFQISTCSNPNDVLDTVSNVIFQWLKLFEMAVSSVLSPESEKGLFGELYLFRTLLREGYVARELEAAWEGPLWSDRDFSFPTAKLEVKLSGAKNPTLKISNERQLEVIREEREFIFLYQVTESRSTGESLVDLIDELRDSISSDLTTLERFNGKLSSYGYIEDDRSLYCKRFSVRKVKVFQILEGFPCITSETLLPGIFNVSYEIELSACEPYRKDYLTVTELINGY